MRQATKRSAPAEPSKKPSGVTTSQSGDSRAAVKIATSLPWSTSHNRIVPSALPEASIRPSGLNASLPIQSTCPLSVCRSSPESGSQSRIASSYPPVAKVRLSGLNERLRTASCPESKSSNSRPDSTSQSFTLPGKAAEAIRRPPGENATAVTKSACPSSALYLPVSRCQIGTNSSTPVAIHAPSSLIASPARPMPVSNRPVQAPRRDVAYVDMVDVSGRAPFRATCMDDRAFADREPDRVRYCARRDVPLENVRVLIGRDETAAPVNDKVSSSIPPGNRWPSNKRGSPERKSHNQNRLPVLVANSDPSAENATAPAAARCPPRTMGSRPPCKSSR